MKKELTITHRLALRGKDVEQLRDLAGRYLSIDPSNTPAKELTERLSAAATKDPQLSRELGESPISLKPSFYLMIATLPNKGDIAKIAQQRAAVFFDKVNARLEKAKTPPLKDFQVTAVSKPTPEIVEIQVTWHQILRYSAPYAKASATMAAFFFPSCPTNTTAICQMKIWHPLWSTCGPLPAVHNQLPATEIIFPVRYLIRSAPEPIAAPVADVVSSVQLKYGTHLADQAGCIDCHTAQVRGQNVSGMDFAGGFPFTGPWGTVASANITPDSSGIPYYDEALFLNVMRTGHVGARELSPTMPVMVYKNLTDDDLKAIFAFLRTTKPVKHRVDNSEAPTECKLCKQKHGGGREN